MIEIESLEGNNMNLKRILTSLIGFPIVALILSISIAIAITVKIKRKTH